MTSNVKNERKGTFHIFVEKSFMSMRACRVQRHVKGEMKDSKNTTVENGGPLISGVGSGRGTKVFSIGKS